MLLCTRATHHAMAKGTHKKWKTWLPQWLRKKISTTTRCICANSSPGKKVYQDFIRVRLLHSYCLQFRTEKGKQRGRFFPIQKKTNKQTKENVRERNICPLTPKCFLRLCVKLKKWENGKAKHTPGAENFWKSSFPKAQRYMKVSRAAQVSTRGFFFSVTLTRKKTIYKIQDWFFVPWKNCMASIVGCASVSDQGKNVLTTYIMLFWRLHSLVSF